MHLINFKKIKSFITGLIIISLVLPMISVQAVMRSDNYIIQESVNYEFDGPVISSISGSPGSTTATITWTTDVAADGFVIYDTNSNFSASKEQGYSAKDSTSHSVILTGILPSTVYYYKVKSTGLNNGYTISDTVNSFTTSAAPAEEEAETVPRLGGGGILIIDKTDKVAPVITIVEIKEIMSDSAIISWQTDEDATSFVEYGKDKSYGNTYGQWDSVKTHEVKLKNLSPETTYYFKALSSDSYGNLGSSGEAEFKTISYLEEGFSEEQKILSEELFADESDAESSLLEKFNILKKMADLIPAASITGAPKVETWSDRAVISWSTDKKANSLVAIAPESDYNSNRSEPYQQIVGDPDNFTLDHRVEIFGLEPDSLYNYQVRMKSIIGTVSKTGNLTFRTITEGLIIDNYYIDIVDNETIKFKWTTNDESDSAVKFAPYRGNVLSVEESKIIKDNTMLVIHDITVKELFPGLFYDIELLSMDMYGNLAIESIGRFYVGEDKEAPTISQVQTNSTIFANKDDNVQTIISWRTNEPAISSVYYFEGVHRSEEEWPNKTQLDDNYTKKHVVVMNNFKSGTVYSFKIECFDSADNASISNVYTFITPKKRETVFDIIIHIFEDLFGWIFLRK